MVRCKIVMVTVCLCLFQAGVYGQTPAATTTYEGCILVGMKGVTSDVAARAIKDACDAQFPASWQDAGIVALLSPQTANNSYVRHHADCDSASPEGYCADEVSISYVVPEHNTYEYRIKESGEGCPNVMIASGPKGWMHVVGCELSIDRASFTARIVGWTLPQVFKVTIEIERRRIRR